MLKLPFLTRSGKAHLRFTEVLLFHIVCTARKTMFLVFDIDRFVLLLLGGVCSAAAVR